MEFNRTMRKMRPISVVSLIDIVFTIILFFMVAGHLEKFGTIAVELPHADSGQHLEEGPVVVMLGKYGEVVINDEMLEGHQIESELKKQFSVNPERVITIKADAHMEANRLVDFLEQIRAAGGKNLSLVTESGTMEVK